MTREEFNNLPKANQKLFAEALSMVTNFMTNKKYDKQTYMNNLLKSIKNFYTLSLDEEKASKLLNGKIGVCMQRNARKLTKAKRKLKKIFKKKPEKNFGKRISTIAIDDTSHNNYLYNLKTLVHEISHADTLNHSEEVYLERYNGLKIKNGGKEFGQGLDEAINEIYTEIIMYEKYPNVFSDINKVDDLLYKPKYIKYNSSFPNINIIYEDNMMIAKLLLIACDNSLTTTYSSLEDTNEPFIEKEVILANGVKVVKNDLLYAGKHDLRMFKENFNYMLGEGKYEELLNNFDLLLSDKNEKKNLKNHQKLLDKKVIIDIINTIDEYKEKKFEIFKENGYWNRAQANYNEMIYRDYKIHLCYIYGIDKYDLEENNKKYTI